MKGFTEGNEDCSACTLDCEATFICGVCGEKKNVCRHLVGGFGSSTGTCAECHVRLFIDRDELNRLKRRRYSTKG